jgi:hypothetical protein
MWGYSRRPGLDAPPHRDIMPPVVSKGSGGLKVVESVQPAETVASGDLAGGLADAIGRFRKQDRVPLFLVVAFGVKVRSIIRECLLQRGLAKLDHSRRALLLDGTIPLLQMRVQIRTPR